MTKILESLSGELAALVGSVPGIVRVEGRRRLAASGVAWSAEGEIVTADHVVRQGNLVRIGLPDGGTDEAALVGRDPTTDLAVLRLASARPSAPAWGSTETMKVGQLALAVGRPGRNVQSSLGIVSGLGGPFQTGMGGTIDRYVQIDTVMYPGFSGGAFVTADGRVAGIVTSGLHRGVSLAVPTETVRRVVEALLAHGRIRRGFLGVGAQSVRLPESAAASAGQAAGLLVVSVEPGSPADQAGLLLGDTLLALDGTPLESMEDLLAVLSGDRVGRPAEVRVLRGGALQSLQATIGERA